MAMKHVVVGGGTGFIGSALVTALKKKTVDTTIISRTEGSSKIKWSTLVQSGLPRETTAVINVAGVNILDPSKRWTSSFKENVWNSRINTTKALSDAIVRTDAKVFVTISGVAYYKPNDKEYTEESKCDKYDFLSELCHEWEEAATLPKESNIRQVIIRSGVVLGRTGGMIKQIFLPFFFGLGGPIGSGKQYMPWIHISDLVKLFIYAIENDNISGVLNGVAPQLVTNKEFTKSFGSALRRPTIIPVPEFILSPIFNKERAKIMTEGQKVIPKRVLRSGFKYQYPDIDSACKQCAKLFYSDPY